MRITTTLLAALLALSSGLVLTSGATTGPARATDWLRVPLSQVNDREIVLELKGAKSASAVCQQHGVAQKRTRSLSRGAIQVVRVPDGQDYHAALARLAADPAVAAAGPNVIKRASEFVPNDPLFLGAADNTTEGLQDPAAKNNQWALLQIGAHDAWDITKGESSIIVAVIDTGVNLDHEDLQGRLWVNSDEIAGNSTDDDGNGFVDDRSGWDFSTWDEGTQSGGDSDPTDPSGQVVSHGTATSSIVGARGNNGLGITGVAGGDSSSNGCRVMTLRVGTDSNITVDAEIGAIDYAIDNGAKIISMSFGGASGGPPEEAAINRAWNAGLLVLAAAGNIGQGNEDGSGNPLVDLPAGFANCMAVGATTVFSSQGVTGSTSIIPETLANYSKTGPELDICAPGTHIMACANEVSGYTNTLSRQFTGTSAATPVVAGAAALVWSATPSLTNAQVRSALESSAVDLGAAGKDEDYGSGRVDVLAALPAPAGKAGDTDGDGDIDDNDVNQIVARFGAHTGDANYDAKADCNNDGVIDELDLFVVGRQYGK